MGVFTILAGPAVADSKVLVNSHIGNQGANDPLAGTIVVTGAGNRVKINSFTANERCTVSFYRADEAVPSAYMSTGLDMLVGLTDDQGPASIAYASKNGGKIVKVDLVLNAGDQIAILLPALIPGSDLLGFPLGGSCGNRLLTLKADSDAGELDWDFSK